MANFLVAFRSKEAEYKHYSLCRSITKEPYFMKIEEYEDILFRNENFLSHQFCVRRVRKAEINLIWIPTETELAHKAIDCFIMPFLILLTIGTCWERFIGVC